MKPVEKYSAPVSRLYAFLLVFLLCSIALVARAVNLQIVDTEFLQDQGEARYLREVVVATRRGNILDRNGEPSLGLRPSLAASRDVCG
jgi:cell division protein FtsI (penicillin-binding protein 3)